MNAASSRGETRVLVVDDHAISRQYTIAALRQTSCSVKHAPSAREALEIALTWLPEVILLDVELAGADGFDVALRIRNAWPLATRQPRIVMLSAALPEAAGRARTRVRTDGFLVKPVSARRLRSAIAGRAREAPAPAAPALPDALLQQLFRAELVSRLDTLDGCLAGRDLPAARAILHQLIASSRLCRQRRLERNMLALHRACHVSCEAEKLGRRYYSLLAAAREYLQDETTPRPDAPPGFRPPG